VFTCLTEGSVKELSGDDKTSSYVTIDHSPVARSSKGLRDRPACNSINHIYTFDQVFRVENLRGNECCMFTYKADSSVLGLYVYNSSFVTFSSIEFKSTDIPYGVQVINSDNITFNHCAFIVGPNSNAAVFVNHTRSVKIYDSGVEQGSVGVAVANSTHFLMEGGVVFATRQACVVFNESTSYSTIYGYNFTDNSGRGVIIGTYGNGQSPNVIVEHDNAISQCRFEQVHGTNLQLGHTSFGTIVSDSNFTVNLIASPQQWSCIMNEESCGNVFVRNVIDNSPDTSYMYVAIMFVNTYGEGTVPSVLKQNFIKLFTEGYAIHVLYPYYNSVQVCASNIVSDTHYSISTNTYIDWSC